MPQEWKYYACQLLSTFWQRDGDLNTRKFPRIDLANSLFMVARPPFLDPQSEAKMMTWSLLQQWTGSCPWSGFTTYSSIALLNCCFYVTPIKDYSSFFCCAQLLSSFQYITHNFHHRYDHLCYNTHNPDKCWCRFIHYVHCNQRPFYSIFIFQDIPQKSLIQSTITIIFYCRYHISYFPTSLKMDSWDL